MCEPPAAIRHALFAAQPAPLISAGRVPHSLIASKSGAFDDCGQFITIALLLAPVDNSVDGLAAIEGYIAPISFHLRALRGASGARA